MMKYKLRPGFSIGVPVDQAAAHLEAMKEANGGEITPAMVVEDARSPDSPIHGCFTWDESAAARSLWLIEARRLIRSYDVHVVSQTETVVVSPGSVRVVSPDNGSVYVSTPLAMSREDYRNQVLAETRATLKGVADRLRRLEGLSPEILIILERLDARVLEELGPKPKRMKKTRRQQQALV